MLNATFIDYRQFRQLNHEKNAVGPLGILGLHRQREGSDGLEKRFKLCQDDLKQLVSDHQEQLRESDGESEWLLEPGVSRLSFSTAKCWRIGIWSRRHAFLSMVQSGEENQLSRLSILYRRGGAQSTKDKKERPASSTNSRPVSNKIKSLSVKQQRHHRLIDAEELSLISGLRRSTLWLFVVWNVFPARIHLCPKSMMPPSLEEHFDLNSYACEVGAIEIRHELKIVGPRCQDR